MQTQQNETGFAVEAGGEVSLVVGDGRRLPLHPVWLRERSRDAEMFDARTSQRLFDPAALPDDLEIEAAAVEADGALAVRFSDGHAARIAARDLVWDAAAREPGRPRPILWEAKTVAAPYFERDQLTQSARARDEAADAFARLGFFIAAGVPCVEGEIERFANLFGPVRATNFGKIFDVRVDSEGNDLAYTGLALTGHTDNPYRRATPRSAIAAHARQRSGGRRIDSRRRLSHRGDYPRRASGGIPRLDRNRNGFSLRRPRYRNRLAPPHRATRCERRLRRGAI